MGQSKFFKMLKKRINKIDESKKSLLAFTTETKKDYIVSEFHKNITDDLDEFIFGSINKMMIFAPP